MHQTVYSNDYDTQCFPTLKESLHCDIAIIGGGLSGLNVAYLLSNPELSICLFEADTIGKSNSGRNTGKITMQQKLLYHDLINNIGLEATKHFVDTSRQAFELIASIIKKHQIHCDYEKSDSIVYTAIQKDIKKIEDEYDACLALGFDVSLEKNIPVDDACLLALRLKDQACYNPKQYCAGLAQVIHQKQVHLYEHSPMIAYKKSEDFITIESKDGHEVTCKHLIVATSFPCFDDGNLYFLRLPNIRDYIVSGQSKTIQSLDAYYHNSHKPSKSIRLYKKQLLICGAAHPVGLERPDPFRELKELGHREYQISTFDYEWGAQDYLTQDLLPYAGYLSPNSKRMFVMTGYNQWGNINSMISAILVSKLLNGIEHPALTLTDPQRVFPLLGGQLLKDTVAMLAELIRSKLQPKEHIPTNPNEHRIVKINGHTYGAYMNEANELFIVDILCPHAGCTLRFNQAEKTWDCPCHSSRYDYRGAILSGPTTKPLHLFNDGYNVIDPHWFD